MNTALSYRLTNNQSWSGRDCESFQAEGGGGTYHWTPSEEPEKMQWGRKGGQSARTRGRKGRQSARTYGSMQQNIFHRLQTHIQVFDLPAIMFL